MASRALLLTALAAALAALIAGAWVWHAHPYTPAEMLALLKAHARDPAAPLLVVAVYVAGGAVLVPVTALIALTGIAFGPKLGALYALLGALASAACGWGVGRSLGAGPVRRYAGPRFEAVRQQLEARGLLAVVLARLVPSGPYTVVNLLAGAAGIRLRDFLVGTVIGMTPGILVMVGLVHGVGELWQRPGWESAALLIAIVVAAVLLAWLLRGVLTRHGGGRPRGDGGRRRRTPARRG